jgi:hypothetical protein
VNREWQTYVCAPFGVEIFLCPADEGLFCVNYMIMFVLAVCCSKTCEATGQSQCSQCRPHDGRVERVLGM